MKHNLFDDTSLLYYKSEQNIRILSYDLLNYNTINIIIIKKTPKIFWLLCHHRNKKIIKQTHIQQRTSTLTQITRLFPQWTRDWPTICHRFVTRMEEWRGEACIQEVLCLLQNFCYLGHSPWEWLPIIREKCAMWSLESSNRGCFLKMSYREVPELRCQSVKRRTTEVDWTKTVVL
jgi:hypothetical protein